MAFQELFKNYVSIFMALIFQLLLPLSAVLPVISILDSNDLEFFIWSHGSSL